VIGSFVDTVKTEFGNCVLCALFDLANKEKSGTIEEEELAVALRLLGFDLKDNQIKGIFA
jgi:Ca2+-binding EF-hand superfamily protein